MGRLCSCCGCLLCIRRYHVAISHQSQGFICENTRFNEELYEQTPAFKPCSIDRVNHKTRFPLCVWRSWRFETRIDVFFLGRRKSPHSLPVVNQKWIFRRQFNNNYRLSACFARRFEIAHNAICPPPWTRADRGKPSGQTHGAETRKE